MALALYQPHGFTPADLLPLPPEGRVQALVEAQMSRLQQVQVLAAVRVAEEAADA
jgi:hypothetical protein